MKIIKTFRRIFAVLFIVAWFGYAFVNLSARFPYLKISFQEGWDLSSTLNNVTATADGGVAYQYVFQDAYGYLRHYLQKQASNDLTIVAAERNQLLYTSFYPYESYSFGDEALRLKEVQNAADSQGSIFLYVNGIDLHDDKADSDNGFPINNLNPRSDAFLHYLSGYGVNYLDARTVLQDSELSPEEYHYRTDPHWTTQAGFEIYLGILDRLKVEGIAVDPDDVYSDRSNFVRTEYPGSFIGATAKRIGLPFTQAEDFTLIQPDFETDFTMEYSAEDNHNARSGAFSTVLLDTGWLSSGNSYDSNLYSVYLTGEYSYRKIINNLNPKGPKILLIGDSNMLPVASFLAAAAGEVELLWPYTLPDNYNLTEYINNNTFDAVIVGMSPSLLYGSGFNYLDGITVAIPEMED